MAYLNHQIHIFKSACFAPAAKVPPSAVYPKEEVFVNSSIQAESNESKAKPQ